MTNTIPNVPRELLERVLRAMIADWMQIDSEWGPADGGIEAEIRDGLLPEIAQLRAILSAPSPAGVDGLEVVAWRIGFPNNSGYKVYEQRQPWAYEQYGVPSVIVYEVQELCRLSDAQATIDGLRGEVAELRKRAKTAEREAGSALRTYKGLEKVARVVSDNSDQVCGELNVFRQQFDQQAQRIGELEGFIQALLLAGNPLSNSAYNLAQHEGHALTKYECELLSSLRKQWDAALSAGKDSV